MDIPITLIKEQLLAEPIPMPATGWYRTYGISSESIIRTYTYLGDHDNPVYDGDSWTVNPIGLFGHNTGGGNNDQAFYKGTPKYDAKMLVLKREGIIE